MSTLEIDITPTRSIPAIDGGRYKSSEKASPGYSVSAVGRAPAGLRVTLQLRQEEHGVWARIDELDVSAEGADVFEALRNIIAAARDLLAYLQDEAPDLAEDLKVQARYVPLLEAKPSSWFRATKFAE